MGKKSSRSSRELSKQITKEKHVDIQIMDELHEAYRNNNFRVNPIDYIMLDKELRDEYEKEFGLDSNDTGYGYYTHEEQIERYAKNMLFWIKHTPNIGSNNLWRMNSDIQTKLIYVTNHMSQLRRKISELRPELQKEIHERVKELQLTK